LGKAGPRWPKVLAVAPTLPRECRVEHSWVYRPGQFDRITAPTLLLTGSVSDPVLAEYTRRAAAAIPNARVRVLDGHAHFAFKTDPAMVASIVRQFIAT
jgi:pimeloyl-ACP methyl ester carboxylesterase